MGKKLDIIKEAISKGDKKNVFDTWTPDAHDRAFHYHMGEHEDWNDEGVETGNERCFDKADDHLEKAEMHAKMHFEKTGCKIKHPNKSFVKLSNPEHVEKSRR